MKTYKYLLAVLLIIVPAISFASIDTNLSFGSRGQAVTDLQNLLISKGFLNAQASGGFYSLTRQAVVAYQASLGLPATGFVGPMTRAKINAKLISQTASAGTLQTTQTQQVQTQTNPTSPTVTPTINPTITATVSTPNSAGQSANTTSITPATTPLLSFSELSPELQNIVKAQEKQVEQMAAQAQNQPAQTTANPACVEKPNLVFEPDRATGSINVTILAIYDTGCPINQNAPWSISDRNGVVYGSGTLGDGYWRFGKENGSTVNNVAVFSRTIQTASTDFTMKTGTKTVQASVSASVQDSTNQPQNPAPTPAPSPAPTYITENTPFGPITYLSTIDPAEKAKLFADVQALAAEAAKNGTLTFTPLDPTEPQPNLEAMRNACTEQPNLFFQAYKGAGISQVVFQASYRAACVIDPNMTWSFSDGKPSDAKSGTLGDKSWIFGRANLSAAYNVAFYYFSGVYPGINTFTFTVGTKTATATINK